MSSPSTRSASNQPGWLDRLFPWRRSRNLQRQMSLERRSFVNQIGAITAGRGGAGGRGGWMGMPAEEDAANKEYAFDRVAIMQRSQDLDVNNPDVGGFNRARVAQILGAGVRFRHTPIAEQVGLTEEQVVAIGEKVDLLRKQHSEAGGFDSQKGQDWEGKRQEQAFLTAFVYGSCLIHRVSPQRDALVPLSLELIPGSRISTPYDKMGDPLVSFGVKYADEHRSRVVGYYVRRVSKTIGNSFVPDYKWDFLPAEDCSILSLTEAAGIDQALPLCTRNMRMLRNRAEFTENTVEGVRAQSAHYAVIKAAPGVDPYNLALDDSDQNLNSSARHGFVELGGGVRAYYALNGEEVSWSSAKLPDPEFAAFMDTTDERIARGYGASKSRFTRKVNNSWAGGRLEDQQDDPIIDQYRLSLRAAWHKVNGWFLEAIFLSGAGGAGGIELPGYSLATRAAWNEFRAEFPGKVDVNPQDTAGAAEKNLMLRKTTPQREIEKTGSDPRDTVREWGKWMKMVRDEEKAAGLEPGSLDILFSGKAVTTSAGQDVGAPTPEDETEPDEPGGDDPAPSRAKRNGKGNPNKTSKAKNRFAGVFRS